MQAPEWACLNYNKIDYNNILYYSVPKAIKKLDSLDEVDPNILETFEKLGIPLTEQKRLANVAVDAIFDSVSIGTTFREELSKVGVIFILVSSLFHSVIESGRIDRWNLVVWNLNCLCFSLLRRLCGLLQGGFW